LKGVSKKELWGWKLFHRALRTLGGSRGKKSNLRGEIRRSLRNVKPALVTKQSERNAKGIMNKKKGRNGRNGWT